MALNHVRCTFAVMNKKITVNLREKSYPIIIGETALSFLPDLIKDAGLGRNAIVITTSRISSLHGEKVKEQLKKSCRNMLWLKIQDSEKSKSAAVALRLIEKITRFAAQKDVFLVALGGGVIGDLSGFIAAIYKRGIPYIQIPTTLLAQVDSAIGGKTALDTKFGKNLIGAFYQPKFVLSDTSLLKTLPRKEVLAGLAEVIKYAVIKNQQLFCFLENNLEKILAFDQKALSYIIATCASIKAEIVSRDEYDKHDIRIILNFGHTIGHAIEAVSNYKIGHGDAVSSGMIYACRLSKNLNLLNEKDAAAIIHLIKKAGLPSKLPTIKPREILKTMSFDKKAKEGKLRFVLIEHIGKTKIVSDVPRQAILKILEETF